MEGLYLILFMMLIGALIGGFTNSLAIKMLFRPYKAIYFLNWRLPFTPGLIPKRRDEMARQLGRLVVEHLLTPESVRKKFIDDKFRKEMTLFTQRELDRILETDQSLEEFLERLGIEDVRIKSKKGLSTLLEKKYESLIRQYGNREIKLVLRPELLEKADDKIPLISSYILQKGIDYFSSIEGKLRIERMIDEFIYNRSGMLGNMLQMIRNNVNIADKIQPEIVKFLSNEGTKDLITTILEKEWHKVLDWDIERVVNLFGKESILLTAEGIVRKLIDVDKILDSKVASVIEPYKASIREKLIPGAVEALGNWLASRIEVIMERLHLSEVVRQQVETFSVDRLEEMVLSISRREFKMITYLGALLGGLIGIIQGAIVILL